MISTGPQVAADPDESESPLVASALQSCDAMSEVLQKVAPPPWRWDKRKRAAAAFFADGELTDAEIAAELSVTRMTLFRWRRHPLFDAHVRELVDMIGAVADRYAITRKARRFAEMQKRWDAMQRIIKERAADPLMQTIPGGSTGLIVSKGSGVIVDSGLLRAMLDIEKQAAIEAGQWGESPVSLAEIHTRLLEALGRITGRRIEDLCGANTPLAGGCPAKDVSGGNGRLSRDGS